MGALVEFKFEDKPFRTVTEDEQTWFVARDICQAMGTTFTTMALKKLDDDEKGLKTIYTLGGNQQLSVVNESGLYTLMFRGNKPEAKRFRKWVTSEVLPSIRKTGSYSMPNRDTTREQLVEPTLSLAASIAVDARAFTDAANQPPSKAILILKQKFQAKTGTDIENFIGFKLIEDFSVKALEPAKQEVSSGLRVVPDPISDQQRIAIHLMREAAGITSNANTKRFWQTLNRRVGVRGIDRVDQRIWPSYVKEAQNICELFKKTKAFNSPKASAKPVKTESVDALKKATAIEGLDADCTEFTKNYFLNGPRPKEEFNATLVVAKELLTRGYTKDETLNLLYKVVVSNKNINFGHGHVNRAVKLAEDEIVEFANSKGVNTPSIWGTLRNKLSM